MCIRVYDVYIIYNVVIPHVYGIRMDVVIVTQVWDIRLVLGYLIVFGEIYTYILLSDRYLYRLPNSFIPTKIYTKYVGSYKSSPVNPVSTKGEFVGKRLKKVSLKILVCRTGYIISPPRSFFEVIAGIFGYRRYCSYIYV